MAMRLKRAFGGKYIVLTEDDEQVLGPTSKAEADAFIKGEASKAPPAAPKGDPEDSKTPVDERAFEARKAADLRIAPTRVASKLRGILAEEGHDEDTINMMMRQIEPILIAGKEGGRRERTRYIRPVQAPKAA